ncbi:MalY/PatB family protein [Nocardioides sp. R-C-SC26]|uniref:MalY/PatB family protein n=1 Tax=Nocardioides sp. R-C-SC26 TaxID=2870414 RepID=UPI001E3E6256|nr:aminotransferase class I/II-fold pyridoxal phosphate-dependent enzyme [Nocardioides sp. R-C-SC26]
MIRDLSDDEARRALVCKWGEVPDDVLPAWVAEMDYAIAPPIAEALHAAIDASRTGYPRFGAGGALGAAYAGFAARHFAHDVDPERVVATVDVTAGVRLALDVAAPAGGLVMPVPGYAPQLEMAAITGRRHHALVVDAEAPRAELDLAALDRHFRDGARVLLLTQPHNPWGRVFTRAELEGVRDVVRRHDAFVVSDEIHAPLVLDGEHVPYLAIDGTADHTVAVVAASKAFNIAGLKCAQLVTASRLLHDALATAPMARNDSWSVLGVEASIAAYTDGDTWLAALLDRLRAQRDLLGHLLADHLPLARMRPLEATYLAWVDLRGYGYDDPAAVALERGRVQIAAGHDYHPGLVGHARINIATSPERLTEIVRRLAAALEA